MGILVDSWTDDPGACGEVRTGYGDWGVIGGMMGFGGMDWMESVQTEMSSEPSTGQANIQG